MQQLRMEEALMRADPLARNVLVLNHQPCDVSEYGAPVDVPPILIRHITAAVHCVGVGGRIEAA